MFLLPCRFKALFRGPKRLACISTYELLYLAFIEWQRVRWLYGYRYPLASFSAKFSKSHFLELSSFHCCLECSIRNVFVLLSFTELLTIKIPHGCRPGQNYGRYPHVGGFTSVVSSRTENTKQTDRLGDSGLGLNSPNIKLEIEANSPGRYVL